MHPVVLDNNQGNFSQIKSFRQRKIRFLQLSLLSIALFGNQYAFNNPQSLQSNLETEPGLELSQVEFNLLYSLFQFPNIFVALVIGFVIDKIGVRKSIICLSGAVMVFQIVVAIGVMVKSFPIILFGRVLFGLASGSLFTAQACMVSYWFKGRQLAFALGIATTFPEMGNALNSYLTPKIYQNSQDLSLPFFISVIICFVSFLSVISLVLIDIKADKSDKDNLLRQVSESSEQEGEKEQVNWRDITKFKPVFWILVALSMLAVALYEPFLDNANDFFNNRFCFNPNKAGQKLMTTYIVCALFSAPLGFLIDKIGFRRYWIILTMLIMLTAHCILLFYPQCIEQIKLGGEWGLLLLGLGYALYANCILASIPLVVKKKNTGTAFGIIHMSESLFLCIFPLISGAIINETKDQKNDNKKDYKNFSLFFFIVSIIGLLISLCLLFISPKVKRKLDSVNRKKRLIEQELNKQSSSSQDLQIQLSKTNKIRKPLKANELGNYQKLIN